ncbi:MAG: NAD-dependent DNA ligase LigA, partial [bacterium]|nr:NAD-dependent DNA ligase LigA [bacterium]
MEIGNWKLEIPSRLVVRGEVFISRKEFERLNREQKSKGGQIFANPRNVAAGSVRQLDSKITASRCLDSFSYDVVTDLGQKKHEEKHKILKTLGFKTNPNNKFCKNLDEVFKFHNYWSKHREKLPYEIDGIVVIVNSNKDFEKAGVVGKAPRAAIAYKFSPKEATTVIEDIRVYVGRTGALTPVAYLRPVEVGGVTISRASLHNEDEIKRLDLKIGDTVIVGRAGDVIPQVTKVLKDLRTGEEKEFKMPKTCPVCGASVARAEGEVIWRCANKFCFAQNREKLYHFVSKAAFDLVGVGPKILDKFIEEDLISDAADIFTLKEGDIAGLERFGEKSAENIINSIGARKIIELSRFIYALGIRHIGEENSIALANKFLKIKKDIGRPADLIVTSRKLDFQDLETVQDFGPKIARSIYDWFQDKKNLRFLEKLDKVGVRIKIVKERAGAVGLKGKTFVLTGGLETLTRDETKRRIRQAGGEISSS